MKPENRGVFFVDSPRFLLDGCRIMCASLQPIQVDGLVDVMQYRMAFHRPRKPAETAQGQVGNRFGAPDNILASHVPGLGNIGAVSFLRSVFPFRQIALVLRPKELAQVGSAAAVEQAGVGRAPGLFLRYRIPGLEKAVAGIERHIVARQVDAEAALHRRAR